jgi:hypothetical protein
MEVANVASGRSYEAAGLAASVCGRVSSQSTEQCVRDQEAGVPGLSSVWSGISVFVGANGDRTESVFRRAWVRLRESCRLAPAHDAP